MAERNVQLFCMLYWKRLVLYKKKENFMTGF